MLRLKAEAGDPEERKCQDWGMQTRLAAMVDEPS